MIMGRQIYSLLIALLAFGSSVKSQDMQVRGYFQVDSAALGEVIPYVLTATYPRNTQVVFPDSTFAFKPFETVGKKFFPTKSTGNISRDSVVYLLSMFELDSTQWLRLPVFVVQPKDCLAVFPEPDSVHLRFRVTMALDSIPPEKLPLKANTAYQRVRQFFNYPIVMIGLGVLVVLAILVWLIFGKQIRRYLLLRRMKRNYVSFLQRFGEAINGMSSGATSLVAEQALLLWKKYMEELERYPFTKSTSREILRQYSGDKLAQALRLIDRGIYGGYGATAEPFRDLQEYSRQQFEKREAEVKHG